MITQLSLIGPRVLVLRDTPEQMAGSIIIPDQARTPAQKMLEGTVLATGPGRLSKRGKLVPTSVARGERVLFGFLDGHDFEEDGRHYVILEDSEIRAVYEDGASDLVDILSSKCGNGSYLALL